MSEETLNFEAAFKRLENILEKMNSGKTSLDEALQLYEEADQLITSCSHRLNQVESRIEMLIKKRNGEFEFDDHDRPLTTAFQLQETGLEV